MKERYISKERGKMKYLFYILTILFFFPYNRDSIAQEIKNLKVTKSEVLKTKAGAGIDEIGVYYPPEAAPEYPESFALSRDEEVYILDTANKRIQVFKKGKRIKTIKTPSEGFFEDIALTPDGKIVLLDNSVKESVYIIDSNGKILSIIPLVGELISYAPETTEVKVIESGKWAGIWVEIELNSVKIANLNGSKTSRVAVPGKIFNDGTRVYETKIIGDATFMLYLYEKESLSKFDELSIFLNEYICGIAPIGTDEKGRIYLHVILGGENCSFNYVLIVNSDLEIAGKFKILPSSVQHPLRVTKDGKVYQLYLDEKRKRVHILKYESLK